MLSELIKDFIDKTQNLQENIDSLTKLKDEIQQSVDEKNLKDKIDSTPYLHSSSFYQKVAQNLPLDELAKKLPQEELEDTFTKITKNLYSPERLAEAIFSSETFKDTLKNRISIEAKSAINSQILLKEFQKALKEQITQLTQIALKENKIDKYRLESAISLMIIRLHTKLALIDDFYDESFKRNLLKRI